MTAEQEAGIAAVAGVRAYATAYDQYITDVLNKADEEPFQGKLTAVQIHALINHLRAHRNNNDAQISPDELDAAARAYNADNSTAAQITIAADDIDAVADALEPLLATRREATGILYTDSLNPVSFRPVFLDTDLSPEARAQLTNTADDVYDAINNGLDRRLTGATVDHDDVVNDALTQKAPLVQQASGVTPANSAAYTQAAQNFMVQAGEYYDLSSRMTWGTTDTTNATAGNAYLVQVRDALTATPPTAIPPIPNDLAQFPGYRELHDSFVESTRAKVALLETLDEIGVPDARHTDVEIALREEAERAGALRGAFAPDQLDSDVITRALNDVQAGLGDEVGRVAGATGQAVDAGGPRRAVQDSDRNAELMRFQALSYALGLNGRVGEAPNVDGLPGPITDAAIAAARAAGIDDFPPAGTDYGAMADILEREVQARLADPARRDSVAATFGDFGADDRLGRAEGRYLDLMLPQVAASLGITDLPEGRGERLAALSGVTTASADDYAGVESMVNAVTGAIGRTQPVASATGEGAGAGEGAGDEEVAATGTVATPDQIREIQVLAGLFASTDLPVTGVYDEATREVLSDLFRAEAPAISGTSFTGDVAEIVGALRGGVAQAVRDSESRTEFVAYLNAMTADGINADEQRMLEAIFASVEGVNGVLNHNGNATDDSKLGLIVGALRGAGVTGLEDIEQSGFTPDEALRVAIALVERSGSVERS